MDVNLLVSTLRYTDTQIGEWINVLGYVQSKSRDSPAPLSTNVQAVMLWSAGFIKLDEYEAMLPAVVTG